MHDRYGMRGDEAIERVTAYYGTRGNTEAGRMSPETDAQRAMVVRYREELEESRA